MSKAPKESLENLPTNTTECPFVPLFSGNKRKHAQEDAGEGGSFFWGEEAKRNKTSQEGIKKGYVCNRCHIPGHHIKDCPAPQTTSIPKGYVCNICKKSDHFIRDCPDRHQQPGRQPKCKLIPNEIKQFLLMYLLVDSCWFCLANPKLEKHLIVSIGTELYATLAKGPIVNQNQVPGGGHLLLLPITHYPTFGKIPAESQMDVVTELEKYKSSIRRMFDLYDQDMVLFEVSRESMHGMAHAHIQVVPVPKSKSDQVEQVARDQAALAGIDFIDQIPVSFRYSIIIVRKILKGLF
jgi:diadenosine tetraphosphate (Ap4A) HIT family hydrolase